MRGKKGKLLDIKERKGRIGHVREGKKGEDEGN